MKVLILNANEVIQAITMTDAIESLRLAFADLSSGLVDMPPRFSIELNKAASDKSSLVTFMPAYLKKPQQVGIKVGSFMPDNSNNILPLIHATILLLDVKTGRLKAIMNGAALTALRTGAASGLATDLLAKHDASNVAIIGAGVQARTQLAAVCAVRNIRNVKVYSKTILSAEKFKADMCNKVNISGQIEVCSTLHEATNDADIICTATTSQTPILELDNIRPGVHINSVGGHTLTTRETSSQIIEAAYVVVEHREATYNESCERNVTELGEIINKVKNARAGDDQITLFASVGTAVQDISVAECIFKNATEKKLGCYIEI